MEEKIERSIEVEDNYQIKKIVGYGSTCTVYKAHYFKHGNPKILSPKQLENEKQVVAIKKVKDIFQSDAHAHRVLREIRLLRILKGHPNIVKLLTIMRPKDSKKFSSLNIVTEYCT